jgi:hypothetical protein
MSDITSQKWSHTIKVDVDKAFAIKEYLTSGLDKGFGIENFLKTHLRTIQ